MGQPDTKAKHFGRNIVRIRELRDIKQETLAAGLGISQQAVSKMEQTAEIDNERLQQVADILGVTVEGLKNFSEDAIINNINCTFADNAINTLYQYNPIEKIVELYDRLLQSEREKVEILTALLKK
jgi:transcriptional regulator with XRE-family HTH domain